MAQLQAPEPNIEPLYFQYSVLRTDAPVGNTADGVGKNRKILYI
nr:MAG TPA: hypothetical protein [Caudoviricetes sp.]